jgi:hypothetical protein
MVYNLEDEDKMNGIILEYTSMNDHHNHEDNDKLHHDDFSSIAASRQPNENNGSIFAEEELVVVEDTITSSSETPQAALAFYDDPNNNYTPLLIAFGAVVVIIASLLLLEIATGTIMRKRRIKKAEKAIFDHLTKFDVQDINLNTAETGGWHGTFHNLLAQGKVRDNKDDVETITDIESSSAVTNSLFMDSRIVGRPHTAATTTTTTIATNNNASLSTLLCDYTINNGDSDDEDDNISIFSSIKMIARRAGRSTDDNISTKAPTTSNRLSKGI